MEVELLNRRGSCQLSVLSLPGHIGNWQSTKGWSELLSRDFYAKVTATGAWRNAEARYSGKRVILIYIQFL